MLSLEDARARVDVSEDGMIVLLTDRSRRCSWRLDRASRTYRRSSGADVRDVALPPGTASLAAEAIRCEHPVDGGRITYIFELGADHVAVRVEVECREVSEVALPGVFDAPDGACEVLVPTYQGLLLRGGGPDSIQRCEHGGHGNFSLAMAAQLARTGGLMIAHESHAGWVATYGVRHHTPYVSFSHTRCPVDGFAEAGVRIYPVDPSVVSVAEQYRRLLRSRGQLVTWPEKLAAKPSLMALFGSLLCFSGYLQDEIDYVRATKALRDYGFPSVLLYPVRMCHYSLGFQMGGMNPVLLSDETLRDLHAVGGVSIAPWAWVFEGIDDGSDTMRDRFRHEDRGASANWAMDDNRWFKVCSSRQAEYMKSRLAGDMAAMDWLHFDVNAAVPPSPCLSARHRHAKDGAMGRIEDLAHTRHLLSTHTVGNRIVSSEGFNDAFADLYDIGSTKMMPAADPASRGIPVPLTMLVLHDCCVHDWWELHNYNSHDFGKVTPSWRGAEGRVGPGLPRIKGAIDALYGCPPNVFPFGAQYGWVDQALGRTFAFRVRLTDRPVQEALRAALPVADLHRRIGQLAMTGFEFLSEDRRLQKTTFADGTSVVANVGEGSQEHEGKEFGGGSWLAGGRGWTLSSPSQESAGW
jgi:hypothetical protein